MTQNSVSKDRFRRDIFVCLIKNIPAYKELSRAVRTQDLWRYWKVEFFNDTSKLKPIQVTYFRFNYVKNV